MSEVYLSIGLYLNYRLYIFDSFACKDYTICIFWNKIIQAIRYVHRGKYSTMTVTPSSGSVYEIIVVVVVVLTFKLYKTRNAIFASEYICLWQCGLKPAL